MLEGLFSSCQVIVQGATAYSQNGEHRFENKKVYHLNYGTRWVMTCEVKVRGSVTKLRLSEIMILTFADKKWRYVLFNKMPYIN